MDVKIALVLILIIGVAVSSYCEGGTFNDGSGFIRSPNYPGVYTDGITDCSWSITVNVGQRISLSFIDFKIEDQSSCNYDWVEIDGATSSRYTTNSRYCGIIPEHTVLSANNTMTIRFGTDGSIIDTGFKLNYQVVNSVLSSCDDGVLNKGSGAILSPNFPDNYPHDITNCSWLITADIGQRISLSFMDFQTQDQTTCNYDYVEIDGASSSQYTRNSRYCGSIPKHTVLSANNSMMVRFTTDGSVTDTGFQLNFHVFYSGGPVMTKLPVWINSYSVDNYLYATDIPALNDFSLCAWMQTPNYPLYDDAIFSIASAGSNNDFLFYTHTTADTCRISALFDRVNKHMYPDCEDYLGLFVGKWHKVCITVQRNIAVKVYTDLHTPNVMELWLNETAPDQGLDGGDTLTIFQEQDAQLDRFSLSQTMHGKLAWFNMWDTTLSFEEIQALDCHSRGDLLTMDTLKRHGNPIFTNYEFPCGDHQFEEMEIKTYHDQIQANMYCKVEGKIMLGPVESTATVQTKSKCAQLCSKDVSCQSANYNKDTKECSLISGTDLEYPENFSSDEAFVHFTTRSCS